jgi:hypothetical protein
MLADPKSDLSTLYGTFQTLWMRSLELGIPEVPGPSPQNAAASPKNFNSYCHLPLGNIAQLRRKKAEVDAHIKALKVQLNERMRQEAIRMKCALDVAVRPEPAVALLESTAAVTRTVKPVQHPAATTLISGDSRALPPRRPRSHRKRPPRISIAPRTRSFVLPAPSQAAENDNDRAHIKSESF